MTPGKCSYSTNLIIKTLRLYAGFKTKLTVLLALFQIKNTVVFSGVIDLISSFDYDIL